MEDLTLETCEALDRLDFVRHAMSRGGDPRWNMSPKTAPADAVRKAWEAFGHRSGIPVNDLIRVNQVHGREVLAVGPSDRGSNGLCGALAGDADGLVTGEPGTPLAILIADCVPVFLADPVRRAVGIAHAGWRGTDHRIAAVTVGALKREFGSAPADMIAWVGPSIGKRAFKVSEDLFERFHVQFKDVPGAFDSDALTIDLKALNRAQLLHAGLVDENIHLSPHCTHDSPEFFSYRRDGTGCGHMMAAIMIDAGGATE